MGRIQVNEQGKRIDKLFYNMSEADLSRLKTADSSQINYADFLPNSLKKKNKNNESSISLKSFWVSVFYNLI